jgi:alkaline phosphatase
MKIRSRIAAAVLALAFAAAPAFAQRVEKAKYVFLFIGDGMSLTQVSAAEVYAKAMAGKEPGFQRLGFTQFPAQGITTTYDSSSIITDSASAVTAIATGHKTLSGVINMDEGKTQRFKTIAEYAKDMGWKVGVVTTVSLDHATPAGFYAKVPSRGDMYDIAVQMGQSGFDYFGGGSITQPKGKKGDQPDAFELAQKAGYTLVNSPAEFRALKPASDLKVIAVNGTLQIPWPCPTISTGPVPTSPSWTTWKRHRAAGQSKGFFFAVESGKIDWPATPTTRPPP